MKTETCTNVDNCRDMIALLKKYPATTPVKFAITTDRLNTNAAAEATEQERE